MALVTATITVDFTANYSGNHRICWRVQGSGVPYDCSTLVNCVGGGTACSAVFTADVNTTSCDGVITFEGYVQAACQDILSTDGRLTWTVDYTPTPTCVRHELECSYVGIQGITIKDPGAGYLIGDTVSLTPVGVDPNLSDAIITISAVGTGSITSITGLASAGSGYTNGDVITVDLLVAPGCSYVTPATITITGVDGGGGVTSYTLTTNGSGYTCNGIFIFTGGTGTGFSVTLTEGVDYNLLGAILGFNISDPGSYNSEPAVTITSGTGAGFVGTVVLENCPAWMTIAQDCSGNTVDLTPGIPLGVTWATCLTTPVVGATYQYTVTQTGCCIPADTINDVCFDYHIENTTGSPQTVQYTACGGTDTITIAIPDSAAVAVCAVEGGIVDYQTPNLTITNLGTSCE